jgi:hypothetical protein
MVSFMQQFPVAEIFVSILSGLYFPLEPEKATD